jgi:hypothetical protein
MSTARANARYGLDIDPAGSSVRPDDVARALAQLSDTERDVLLILALEGDTLARAEWLTRIRDRRPWIRGDRSIGHATLKQIDERLSRAGLIERGRPGFFAVPVDVAMAVLEAADREDRRRVDEMMGPNRYAWSRPIATLRLGMLRGDARAVADAMSSSHYMYRSDPTRLLTSALGDAMRPQWLALLPESDLATITRGLLRDGITGLAVVPTPVLDLAAGSDDPKLRLLLMRWRAMRGVEDPAEGLGKLPKWGAEAASVLAAFWRGDHARAAEIGDAAVAAMGNRKRKFLPDLEGLVHAIASMSQLTHDPGRRQRVYDVLLDACERGRGAGSELFGLAALARRLVEPQTQRPTILGWWSDVRPDWTSAWVEALVRVWWPDDADAPTGPRREPEREQEARARLEAALATCIRLASERGYAPVAAVLDDARVAVAGSPRPGGLAASFVPPAAWQAALASVEAVAESLSAEPTTSTVASRAASIRWEVVVSERGAFAYPRLAKSERARKGSPISLERLQSPELADVLTTADRRVLAALEIDDDPYTLRAPQYFGGRAVEALIGHPRVIDEDGRSVEVIVGTPKLCTVATPEGIRASMFPSALAPSSIGAPRGCKRWRSSWRPRTGSSSPTMDASVSVGRWR